MLQVKGTSQCTTTQSYLRSREDRLQDEEHRSARLDVEAKLVRKQGLKETESRRVRAII